MTLPAAIRRCYLWTLLTLPGCASAIPSVVDQVQPTGGWCCTRSSEAVTLEYLGVGGWLIRMGDAAVLTAPLFSNPGMLDVAFGRIESDSALIEQFLPPVDDVSALLVGHAHYDHLMDVPHILRRKATGATLYGSRTAVNLVQGDPGVEPHRLVSVEEGVGDHERPGVWYHTAEGRVRIMALVSGHAPHFMGIHLWDGQLEEPVEALPRRASGWLEGTPLAYLVDFLNGDGSVAFRIHYQDAASEPPAGFPPILDDDVPIDLAILCPPGFEEVDGFPEGILERLQPRAVLLGHWENFFRPRTEPLQGVPSTDLDEFLRRLDGILPAGVPRAMPEPGEVIRVRAGVGS
ncbi:MAG: hypothetical protein WEA09_02945 [Gemmatimonadota bacterium]